MRDKYQHQLQKKIKAAAAAAAAASASLNSAACTLSVQASGAERFGAASGTLCMVASPPAQEGRASTSQDAVVDEGGPLLDFALPQAVSDTYTYVHSPALPQAVSQDLEAGAPEMAASPRPLNAEHDPLHVASLPVLVYEAACGAATGPLLSDALRSTASAGSMQSQDSDHAATNPQQRAVGGLEMSVVATAAEASRAEAGSAVHGGLLVGQERDEGHVTRSGSQEGEGNADDMAESTRQNKIRKAKKNFRLTSTAAHDLALPQAGWQDLEAGAPERASSPSPSTAQHHSQHIAQHHPQHIASPPVHLLVLHGAAVK